MELNTALWALSYPEVRKEKPYDEMEKYVQMAQDGIRLASERWPGVESALELYENLIRACLKAYDGNTSYVIRTPCNKESTLPPHEVITPHPLSSPSNVVSSNTSRQEPPTARLSPYRNASDADQASDQRTASSPARSELSFTESQRPFPSPMSISRQPSFQYTTTYQDTTFDPYSLYNNLPTPLIHTWNPGLSPEFQSVQLGAYFAPQKEPGLYFDAIGDQYSQYLHAPYTPQQPLQSLNQEQQFELMTDLEKTGPRSMGSTAQPARPGSQSYAR